MIKRVLTTCDRSIPCALGLALAVGACILTARAERLQLAGAGGLGFHIDRWTIDGGGAMSSGGAFELAGTIGQCDAGTLLGGDFELNGGFWFPISLGDCNTDGLVNLYDHDFFMNCFAGPDSESAPLICTCSDHDEDGDVDLQDWGRLQNAMGN